MSTPRIINATVLSSLVSDVGELQFLKMDDKWEFILIGESLVRGALCCTNQKYTDMTKAIEDFQTLTFKHVSSHPAVMSENVEAA